MLRIWFFQSGSRALGNNLSWVRGTSRLLIYGSEDGHLKSIIDADSPDFTVSRVPVLMVPYSMSLTNSVLSTI